MMDAPSRSPPSSSRASPTSRSTATVRASSTSRRCSPTRAWRGGGADVDPALRHVVLVFVEELREQLTRIGVALAAMERDAATVPGEIEELFRQAHSWKGSAASLGLDELATLAHELESA